MGYVIINCPFFAYILIFMSNETIATPKFPVMAKSLHAELKRRVNLYLEEHSVTATGNYKLFSKAIILMSLFVVTYIHLVFFTPPTFYAILECVLFGGLIAAIGFNVMHDGSHGSFSKYNWLNKLASSSISVLGASRFMWASKHVTIHHTFTNIEGVDDDIEVGALMRMAPNQKHYILHRFQHIYFWVLYMLLYIFWIFYTDYKKYFSKKIGSVPLKKMSIADHLEFWIVKLYHAAVFIIIPVYMVGWVSWLVGFFVTGCFAGFILSIVFQLAHTVTETEFPVAIQPENVMPDEFAAHQIMTTANFATKSKLVSWLVGGLNFQIEHHLFPKISHVHYPAISKIVKDTCADFKLKYNEYPTVLSAIRAHVLHLKSLSKPGFA
jgi:linoleoyl-CoA desaturase